MVVGAVFGCNERQYTNVVIMDGDVSMRNAIKKVFPNNYHRLYAWNLLLNTISNIGNPNFIPIFKKCMIGDHDVWKFENI